MSTALTLHQVDAPAVTTNNAALIKALAAACDEVKGVEKKGQNKEQGYKYQKAADVAIAIRHELFKRGIIILQSEMAPEFHPFETKSGSKQIECRIGINYRIMGEGGFIEVTGYGVGRDSGDKAIWKAKTGAVKYFLRGLGLIPDEKEDPEYDGGDKPDSRAEQGELAEDRHDAIRLGGIIKSEKESTDRQGKTFIWYQIETLTNEGQTTILVASPKDTDSGRLADKVGWLVDIEVVPNESVRAGVFTLVRVMNVRKPLPQAAPKHQDETTQFEREMDAPPEVAAPVSDDKGGWPVQPKSSGRTVSEKQVKRLWAIAGSHGVDKATVIELCGQYGAESPAELNTKAYNDVCTMLEQYVSAPPADEDIPY